jgi:predicted metal-binding membrane protein
MNVVWMAGLGLIMTVEKITSTPRFSRILGVIFLAIGVAILAASAAGFGWARFGAPSSV